MVRKKQQRQAEVERSASLGREILPKIIREKRSNGRSPLCRRCTAIRSNSSTGCQTATFKWWRRGELNPRPRNLATRSLHAYPVPLVSLLALRTGKTR